jgi:hypothetical protein
MAARAAPTAVLARGMDLNIILLLEKLEIRGV